MSQLPPRMQPVRRPNVRHFRISFGPDRRRLLRHRRPDFGRPLQRDQHGPVHSLIIATVHKLEKNELDTLSSAVIVCCQKRTCIV